MSRNELNECHQTCLRCFARLKYRNSRRSGLYLLVLGTASSTHCFYYVFCWWTANVFSHSTFQTRAKCVLPVATLVLVNVFAFSVYGYSENDYSTSNCKNVNVVCQMMRSLSLYYFFSILTFLFIPRGLL
jgi:hypothetical protein